MSVLKLGLKPLEEHELIARADSLGISLAAYVRNVVRDSLRRNPEPVSAQVHRTIRALIPVIANGLGITQHADEKQISELTKHLLETFDKECK